MEKQQYFKKLEEIITDPIFIGFSKEDLDEEVSNNMWHISLEQQLAREISIDDFIRFFNDVIRNRQDQVSDSSEMHGMIFYLWFDWMSSQLRFNLISNIHDYLPFQCELKFLDKMDPIIKEFLDFPFLNGLPTDGYTDGSEEKTYILKVYKTVLNKKI